MTEKKNLDPFFSPENWIMLIILIVIAYGGAGFFIYWAISHPTHDHHRCPVPSCEYNTKKMI